jgi:Predicted GTPase
MKERLQINILVLGPVSAGKSTFINALFTEQYTDMKLQRTTATPQVYHEVGDIIKYKTNLSKIRENNRKINETIMEKSEKGLTMDDIKEVEYYVPKIYDMPKLEKDVVLSIYDTPGINDAKTVQIYKEYVKNIIYKIDVATLIIDIHSSFNTKEEIDILELTILGIKENKDKYKIDTELMILLNKCDENGIRF